MNTDKLNTSIQVFTLLAVVVGIALVVYELREARLMSQAQLSSEAFALHEQRYLTTAGEDLAQTLETACFNPSELTPKDAFILSDYYHAQWNSVRRLTNMENFGFDVPANPLATATLENILSFPSGLAWYRANQSWVHERYRLVAEKIMENPNQLSCTDYVHKILTTTGA
ncbi:MAG: hypothetical protein AAF541_04960 [Pseudomonadota bacterium]